MYQIKPNYALQLGDYNKERRMIVWGGATWSIGYLPKEQSQYFGMVRSIEDATTVGKGEAVARLWREQSIQRVMQNMLDEGTLPMGYLNSASVQNALASAWEQAKFYRLVDLNGPSRMEEFASPTEQDLGDMVGIFFRRKNAA